MLSVLGNFVSHPAILVGLGGAIGANARYWLGIWFKRQEWAVDFFWGTLVINVIGSALLGLVLGLSRDKSSSLYLLLGVGFCGGFTTFSTFSLELAEFLDAGRYDLLALYLGGSVLLGLAAFVGAYAAVR